MNKNFDKISSRSIYRYNSIKSKNETNFWRVNSKVWLLIRLSAKEKKSVSETKKDETILG